MRNEDTTAPAGGHAILPHSSILEARIGSFGEAIVKKRFLVALAALAFAATAVANAQTVVNLKNQAPDGVIVAMLLTDGRVLAQGENSF